MLLGDCMNDITKLQKDTGQLIAYQDDCEHPFYCLILKDAYYENPMDNDWSTNYATLVCTRCNKVLKLSNKSGTGYCNYYRNGEIIHD
jgi:hypothetical protein